ncbi:tandem-95 repeat protein [Congregibacter brevis]|uniref:Tandem-95 repeat protein n=1 Tax=Congregibacter brevis TaxID=3081201 RepID=A0ABZ0IFC1_9GAMM|nr:tandem-95 repeat protein [Congregibacter sp. IMCC45268]
MAFGFSFGSRFTNRGGRGEPDGDPITSVDDTVAVREDRSVVIQKKALLSNDSAADDIDFSLVEFTQPANGTLVENGQTLKYTPNPDFFGEDSFEYTIALDGNAGQTSTATVNLVVLGSNDDPTGSDVELEVSADTVLRIPVTELLEKSGADDVDGDDLSIASFRKARDGEVEFDPSDSDFIIFTPDEGFTGEASFEYTIEDGNGGSVRLEATVDVVAGDNQSPTAVDDSYTVAEGNELTGNLIEGLGPDAGMDSDPEGTLLSVTKVNDIELDVNDPDLEYSEETEEFQLSIAEGDLFIKADGSFRYVHGGDEPQQSAPTFTYTISDGDLTDTADVTINVTPVNDAPTGAVAISGTATDGDELTASNTLEDEDGLGDISYQWQRGGEDIDGATGDKYTLTQDDVGVEITVVASYTDAQGTDEQVSSAPVIPTNENDAPTGSVTITGTAEEDSELTASNDLDDADGLGDISYQWQRGGVDIDGATGDKYTLTQEDVGENITVVASYTDDGGTAEQVESLAVGPVANLNDAPTGSVTISGTATDGDELTASNTLEDEDGLGDISYQWQRGGVDIDGATGDKYTLTQDDVGVEITVVASYTDAQGTDEQVSSAPVIPTNENDAPTGVVTIDNTTPAEDDVLTASNTLADADGLGTITYTWKADGNVVGTGATYTLTQAEVGKQITAEASYTDGGNTTETVASGATAAVTNLNDAPTGSVTISGTATDGDELTASNTLEDEDGLGDISYQWQRGGEDIDGATGEKYTLTQDDVGVEITVVASYTDAQGTDEQVSSDPVIPTNENDAPTGSVTITGTAEEDSELTASNDLDDADGLGDISYQWQRGGVDIDGATGDKYTLTQEDVGENITVVASYTDDGGTAEQVESLAVGPVANLNDAPTGSVTISGTATDGDELTASNTLEDEDGLGDISYQWQRGGVDIDGATGDKYTLTQDDVGVEITVVASYTDAQGTDEQVSSDPVIPTNENDAPTGSVTITGTAEEDSELTASNDLDDADGLGDISYQWQRGGVDIDGATGDKYTLTQEDVGENITVVASYTDDGGTAEQVESLAVGPVANLNDAPTGSVTISGTATDGDELTASNTLEDEDGLGDISYQWQRGGVDIDGATGDKYTLTQDDVGVEITVVASYTDAQGTDEQVSSDPVIPTNENDAPTGSVTITGTAEEDSELTASNDLDDADGLGDISYQWQRGGVDIDGATGDKYTLTQEDVGENITVVASYTDDDGTAEQVESLAVGPIANVNDAPVAFDDDLSVNEDSILTLSSAAILGNDTDVDNTEFASITLASLPESGVLYFEADAISELPSGGLEITVADLLANKLTFAPAEGSEGVTLTYTVSDGDLSSNEATISIAVNAVDAVFSDDDEIASTDEDVQLTGNVLDGTPASTADGDVVVTGFEFGGVDYDAGDDASIVGVGTLNIASDGAYSFTPAPNYSGLVPDAVYSMSDDLGNTVGDTSTLSITIDPVNDAPNVIDTSFKTTEDKVLLLSTADLLGSSSDPEGNPLSAVVDLSSISQGTLEKVGDDEYRFTPAQDQTADATFSYTVDDGQGGESGATATIAITAVNDAPTSSGIDLGAMDEDGVLTTSPADLIASASDVDGDALTLVSVGNASTGTVVIDGVTGEVVFTPAANVNGPASYDYTISDGAIEVTATATIAITSVNDAPTGTAATFATQENAPREITFAELLSGSNAADADADASLTITNVTNPQGGTVSVDGETITFTPAQDFDGAATFDYTISDGTVGDDLPLTATVNVSDVANVEPTAEAANYATDEDAPLEIALLDLLADSNAVDTDGGTLSITGVGNAVGGTVAVVDGSIVFTPTEDFFGDASFDYTVQDGQGGAVPLTAAIAVNSVNDAPVGQSDDGGDVEALQQIIIDVLANDSDLETALDVGSVEIIDAANNGQADVNPDGTITYTAGNGFIGGDSFSYRVADVDGAFTQPVNVTVNITGEVEDGNSQDGYISGGFVWADADGDGEFDPGLEAFGTTNEVGQFSLSGAVSGTLYMTGGVDISTRLPFEGVLKAPEGSTVITPLTTLVVAVLESGDPTLPSDPALALAEAELRVQQSLGLPDVDLSTYDPIDVLANSVDPAAKEQAAAVFSVASQVLNTAKIAGSAVAGASGGEVSETEGESAAFASLANLINTSPSPVNLVAPEGGGASDVEQIVSGAADEAAEASGITDIPVQAEAVASLAEASNTVVDTAVADAVATGNVDGAAFLSDVSQVSQVAQGETADAVSDGDVSVADTTQFVDELETEVEAAVVGDATGATESPDDDLLVGDAGDNVLDGGVGNDIITGNGGVDTLTGGEGDDVVTGGSGNDILIAGAGTDVYKGTLDSFDTIDYSSSPTGVNVNLETGVVIEDGFGDTDSLENIDRVVGSAGDDTILGRVDQDGTFDRFRPGDGTDLVDGQGGNDAVDYRDAVNGSSGVTINLGANGDANGTAIDPWGNTDTLLNINRAFGSEQGDSITGDGQDNVLAAAGGDDDIAGGLGADLLFGQDGDDTLTSNGGNDYLDGGSGADIYVIEGTGDRSIGSFEFGVDKIDLSGLPYFVSEAYLQAQLANQDNTDGATFLQLGPDTTLFVSDPTWAPNEELQLSDFILPAADPADDQIGGPGDDALQGGTGDTTFFGDAGNDFITAGPGNENIDGGTGFDIVDYNGAPLGIDVDLGAGTVTGGFGGTDTITNVEKIIASDFDDSLVGGDTDAPQSFEGRGGDDYIDGGAGVNDRIDHRFSDTGSGINANLATGIVQDEFGGTDTVVNIERVYGTIYDDVITGDDNDNQFIGDRGADDIDGGEGFDALFNNGTEDQSLEINLATGQVANDGYGFTGTVAGIERVFGTAQSDVIIGDANRNELFGQDGNDTLDHGSGEGNYLEGGAGNDTFQLNSGSVYIGDFNPLEDRIDLSGALSPVTDFAQVQNALNQYTVEEDDGNGGTVDVVHTDIALPGLFITLRGVSQAEIETGGAALFDFGVAVGPDDQIGDEFDNTLEGGAGDTNFVGGAGNDTIVAGPGNDSIDGGEGFDFADYSGAGLGIQVDLAAQTVTGGFGGTDTIVNIEKVIGTDSGDSFVGADNGNAPQSFEGRGGDDYIDGGAGTNDRIDHRFTDTGSGINADLSTGIVLDEFGGTDTVVNIERVYGTIYDDVITGDDNDNQFIGAQGFDIINGGGGTDALFNNGDENQSLIIDLSSGVVTNDGYGFGGEVSSIENVFGTANNDTLVGDSQDNLLLGAAGSDFLDGGAGNDVLLAGFSDDAAADTFIDGIGSDYLEGGAGIDTFVIQGGGDDTVAQFELGVDKIDLTTLPFLVTGADITNQLSNQSDTDSGTFFTFGTATLFIGGDTWSPDEEISLTDFILPASTAGSTVDGTDGDDNLVGTDGDDTFNALGNTENGIDFIIGGAGNDIIDGGDGFDAVDYSAAPAGISADLESGAIADGFGGIDTVSNVERVIGSAFNDVIFGRVDNQGGEFGDFDRFVPGDGADYIDGRGGNDIVDYRGDDTGSGIIVNLSFNGQGNGAALDQFGSFDNILNVSGVFATENDDRLFGGDEENRLFGFGGNDEIFGRSGKDQLFGGDGDDELHAGDGVDEYLEGGAGFDTFFVGNGSVFIGDFNALEDVIDFSDSEVPVPDVFTLQAPGVTTERTENEEVSEGVFEDVVYTDITLPGISITLRGVAVSELGAGNFSGFRALDADNFGASSIEGTEFDDNFGDNTQLDGGTGNDTINGLAGNDALRGFSGDDILSGGEGDDYLEGGFGDDELFGQSGDFDSLAGGPGNDLLDGGDGFADSVDYASFQFQSQRGAVVNLSLNTTDVRDFDGNPLGTNQAQDPDGGFDTLAGIENVNGSDFNDIIVGSTGDNFLSGGFGDDLLFGGGGGSDNFAPGSGQDQVTGNGDDGVDYFDYGRRDGFDPQFNSANGIFVNLGEEGTNFQGFGPWLESGQAQDPDGFVDQLNGINGINGTAFSDVIVGGNSDNFFGGQDGNDFLIGGGGNDNLQGEVGDDNLQGGAGNDSLFGGSENDALDGGDGDDYLQGDDGDDELRAGNGANDSLNGGAGADNFVVGNGGVFIGDFEIGVDTIDLRETQVPVPDFATVQANLTEFMGTEPGDENTVYSQIDLPGLSITLREVSNQDLIDNQGNIFVNYSDFDSDQTIDGTINDDNFDLADPQLDGGSGNDTINGLAGNDALRGFVGNDTLNGDEGDDYLEGGFGNDQLFGGEGNDSLNGGSGDDLINGGDGPFNQDGFDDGYDEVLYDGGYAFNGDLYLNLSEIDPNNPGQAWDFGNGLFLQSGQAIDPDGGLDTLVGIEGIWAGDGNDQIVVGAEGVGNVWGGAGDDGIVVAGSWGANIQPGDGFNYVDGGNQWSNLDLNEGQFANPNGVGIYLGEFGTYDFDSRGEAYTPDGFVTELYNINNANGGEFDDEIFGNSSDNSLSGRGGNDVIDGADGNDNLFGDDGDDELRAGNGANDSLNGGAGADNFVVGNGGVFIGDFEIGVDTIDLRETQVPVPDFATVQANLTEFMGTEPGDENTVYSQIDLPGLSITLREVSNQDLIDNQGNIFVNYSDFDSDQTIDGTINDDNFDLADPQLDGGSGNDTINGLAGNDALRGFVGNDTLNGDEGDDYLEGGFGNDQLFGGEGNDSLNGGSGDDLINGGDGPFNQDGFDDGYDEVLYDGGYAFNGDLYLNLSEIDPNNPGQAWDFGNGLFLQSGQAIDPDGGLDTLVGIEGIWAGDGNDQIVVGAEGVGNVWGGAGDDGIVVAGSWGANIQPGDGFNYVDGGNQWSNLDLNEGQFANPNGVGIYLGEFGTYDFDSRGEAYTPDGFVTELYNINNANGGEFDDEIFGNSSDNSLSGRGGNDVIDGADGNDNLFGDDGDDELRAGNGANDSLNGGAGADNFVVGNGGVFIGDFEIGVDTIDLRETQVPVPDFATVQANLTEFMGTEPGDENTVYSQIDLPGLSITLREVSNQDLIDNQGNIFVNYSDFDSDQTIDGTINDDNFDLADPQLDGGSGNDTINGLAGNDALRGFVGNDTLNGDEGDDYLEGGFGNDQLFGGEGDFDNLAGGPGDDVLDGGEGIRDRANYESFQFQSQRGVVVNLSNRTDIEDENGSEVLTGTARDPDFFTDTLVGIEEVSGTSYNDWIVGDDGDNNFAGGPGNDLLEGMGGYDKLDYSSFTYLNERGAIVNLSDATFIVDENGVPVDPGTARDPDLFTDTLFGFDGVSGGDFDDQLYGNENDNLLQGQGGNDLLVGNGGNDQLEGGTGTNTYLAGSGSDTVTGQVDAFDILNLSEATETGVVVDLDLASNQVSQDGFNSSDTVTDINRVIGSGFDDIISGRTDQGLAEGSREFERFVGGPGNDTINGRGGNDGVDYRFESGPWADTGNGVSIDLNTGIATDPFGGTDTISGVSRVFGSENNDVIRGDAQDNPLLFGFGGDDLINGGAGNDFLFGGEGLDTFEFGAGAGSDVIGDFTLGEDSISLIDGLTATSEQIDTNGDFEVDSTLVTFSNGEGDVLLSDILLTQEELFG